MKEKINQILSWANEAQRPKKIFSFFICFMLISSIIAIIREIYFPSQLSFTDNTPNIYIQSDKEKEKLQVKEAKLEKVMKELYLFQEKKKNENLTKNDSIRIEYLYNEYKKLKNGY